LPPRDRRWWKCCEENGCELLGRKDGQGISRLRWNAVEMVIVHAEKVASDGGNVVGLGRVGDSIVLVEEDALRGQGCKG
jgi:hypothetical protein